ncbi:hypothetical protein AB1Y20_013376 [Prymnesium parvum]|uniref:DUF1279 domain-containing protein n=1 Tax=Prymnesium parvum TaxID=97485 RepID=A0AB34IG97_PRYPA
MDSTSPRLRLSLLSLAMLPWGSSGIVLSPACRANGCIAPSSRAPPPQLLARKPSEEKSPETITEKFGLEAGLLSALQERAKAEDEEQKSTAMVKAGDLLKRYGGAYLLTSTSLAAVSFTLCYLLIDNGVDVGALLGKLGIEVSGTSETVGTVGLAYAIHKAASPVRFPPTVALTPLVARKLFGKVEEDEESA